MFLTIFTLTFVLLKRINSEVEVKMEEIIYNQEFKVENMPEVKWFLVDRKIYTRFCFNNIHMEYAIPTQMLNMSDEELIENKKLVGRYR